MFPIGGVTVRRSGCLHLPIWPTSMVDAAVGLAFWKT
jgi:hypothetical protein